MPHLMLLRMRAEISLPTLSLSAIAVVDLLLNSSNRLLIEGVVLEH